MSRKKSREYAFRLVFEQFFHEQNEDIFLENEEFDINTLDKDFVNSLIGGINVHYTDIMEIIKSNTTGFEIDRIFKVDLAILVLAVYELKFAEEEMPTNVIINEAVELTKKYSTEKSYSFVNGVLAKVVKC